MLFLGTDMDFLLELFLMYVDSQQQAKFVAKKSIMKTMIEILAVLNVWKLGLDE